MTRLRRALAQLRALLFGPPAPQSVRPDIDYAVLYAAGGIWRERTRAVVAETSGAKNFAIGFAFGGITIFGVIAWLAAGMTI